MPLHRDERKVVKESFRLVWVIVAEKVKMIKLDSSPNSQSALQVGEIDGQCD